LEIDVGDLAHRQLESCLGLSQKARLFDFDVVNAGRQQYDPILPVLSGLASRRIPVRLLLR